MANIKVAVFEIDGTEYDTPREYDLAQAITDVGFTGGGGSRHHKTATVLTNSSNSTWVLPSDLAINMVAGKVYKVEWWLLYRSSAASAGIVLQLTGSAGLTRFAAQARNMTAATVQSVTTMTSLNSAYTFATTASANTNYLAIVEAIFVCSSNGTIAINFRSETNNQTITLDAGSFLSYAEL